MESARINTTDLGGPLLASVSRSFYLSIRLLPAVLRRPIGLAPRNLLSRQNTAHQRVGALQAGGDIPIRQCLHLKLMQAAKGGDLIKG